MPLRYESHWRSIAKSVTFRIVVLFSDTLVVYLFTDRLDVAIGLVILTNLSSAVLYYLHERVWDKTAWGRVNRHDAGVNGGI